MKTWKTKADRKEKGGLHLKRLWVLTFVQLLFKTVLHSSHLLSKNCPSCLTAIPYPAATSTVIKKQLVCVKPVTATFLQTRTMIRATPPRDKADQNCNNQVRRSLSPHASQIILSLSHSLIEKRPNYQNKGPICRRIGKALCNLMKYLKNPCDNHGRRHCLLTRASKLASNWFTWNAGGIFLALYICFLLD